MMRVLRFLEVLGWRVLRVMIATGLFICAIGGMAVFVARLSDRAQSLIAITMVAVLLLIAAGQIVYGLGLLVRGAWRDTESEHR